jgi:hypothetical protein
MALTNSDETRLTTMSHHLRRPIFKAPLVAALAVLITGCGGGGDAGSNSSTAAVSASATISPLTFLHGTYTVACLGHRYTNGDISSQGTITVAAVPGSAESEVTVRVQTYTGSTSCNAANVDFDASATGRLTKKDMTKIYTMATGERFTANVVTVKYSGLTLSKGSITTGLPALGVTTDMAYVLDGNTLHLASGYRDADGLGEILHERTATKQ